MHSGRNIKRTLNQLCRLRSLVGFTSFERGSHFKDGLSSLEIVVRMHAPTILDKENLTGICWMIASMAVFAVEDVFIKTATKQMPIGQVLVLFGTGGAVFFAYLARRNGSNAFTTQALSRIMLIRACFELVGRLFYGLAIALTPLSSATALLQATPIIVVLGATAFFGEAVNWRRWCAIIAGLIGVLIILRPAADDFSALSILAVVGTLGFAGRDLASRAAPAVLTTWILGLYGFLTVVAAGALYSWFDGKTYVWPTTANAMGMAGAVVAGVFAYSALMKAMRTGSVSVVTPFRYTRLLFGISLGVAVFGERVDAPMILGCLVVIGSGLVVWWQGRAVQRNAQGARLDERQRSN
jgi:drug/metabolite transporter (DMT)-like permease